MTDIIKERPILFSGPMVRAILENRKTQTRRIVKVQPVVYGNDPGAPWRAKFAESCPYGKPGDRLYVKEEHYLYGNWSLSLDREWRFQVVRDRGVLFNPPEYNLLVKRTDLNGWYKRNSLFMPRWASRITLTITDIRVERLQDISEEDAISEGVESEEFLASQEEYDSIMPAGESSGRPTARGCYQSLWDSINGKRAPWDSNPWVWVVAFRRVA